MLNKYTSTFLLVVSTIILSGCKSEQDKAIEITEKEIRSTLLDPAAGIFTNVKAVSIDDHGMYIVCGEVNGKNSYGAYSGAKEFNAFIYNVNDDGSLPLVSMGNSDPGSRELKYFSQQRIACEKDGVQKYKHEQERLASIDKRVDELKSTVLGSLVYSAAESISDWPTAMGDDVEVMDVKTAMSTDKVYAYITMHLENRDDEFFKFKKNASGEYVSVVGDSYEKGMPQPVERCGKYDDKNKCISDAEIERLNTNSDKFKNFIMVGK